MTTVKVKKNEDKSINEILVYGHSGYDDVGKDIVCSAVSTAMFVSLGLVEKTCSNYTFENDEKSASMKLKIKETNETTNLVLENLVSSLEGISLDYKKYLKVKFEK